MGRKTYLTIFSLFLVLAFLAGGGTAMVAADLEEGRANETVADSAVEQSSAIESQFKIELASMSTTSIRTRNASEKVYTPSGGHGSGAYYLFEGHHVVFTAAHVTSEGPIYAIVDSHGSVRMGQLVHVDKDQDFAIILIPEFTKTKPLKVKLPKVPADGKIGRELVFSGYPSQMGLTTVRGRVAGGADGIIVMHSAAWMGSSGSSVFDERGNLVGILYAVSLGRWQGEPVIMEDMVWVVSSSAINWAAARDAVRKLH